MRAGEPAGSSAPLVSPADLQQRLRGRVLRIEQHLSRFPLLHHTPIRQDDHPRRKLFDELVVMRGHHERAAFAGQRSQCLAQFVAARRVERGGGLVEQQQRRIDGQRTGNRSALRFAT